MPVWPRRPGATSWYYESCAPRASPGGVCSVGEDELDGAVVGAGYVEEFTVRGVGAHHRNRCYLVQTNTRCLFRRWSIKPCERSVVTDLMCKQPPSSRHASPHNGMPQGSFDSKTTKPDISSARIDRFKRRNIRQSLTSLTTLSQDLDQSELSWNDRQNTTYLHVTAQLSASNN